MITTRDLRVRYKQTVMGFLWALLTPAMVVGASIVIRLIMSRGGALDPTVIAGIVAKSLPWAFFNSALKSSTQSLLGNKNLVAKVAFPKEIFPIAAVVTAFVDFLIASCVATVVLLFIVDDWSSWALLAVPMVLILALLVAGLGLMLSSLNLFFRDVKYVVDALLSFAIFFTPVMYDASMLGKYEPLVMLNPVSPILEGLRNVVVHAEPPHWGWLAYSAVFAVVAYTAGYRIFKNLEYKFAESV
jgi:ABC-type polysaccharide/polyol phosphate export permease